jgi:hypothetical protein
MITNWKKNEAGHWRGFVIYMDEEEKTEIYDSMSWGEWFSSFWF